MAPLSDEAYAQAVALGKAQAAQDMAETQLARANETIGMAGQQPLAERLQSHAKTAALVSIGQSLLIIAGIASEWRDAMRAPQYVGQLIADEQPVATKGGSK